MGIEHVTWAPGMYDSPPQKFTYHIDMGEMANDYLMWQVRLCQVPGEVHVIAAFKECEDAITFMNALHENGKHGYLAKEDHNILGFSKDNGNYSIEHNSSTEYVEMTFKKLKNDNI